jgi:hypothetical protein
MVQFITHLEGSIIFSNQRVDMVLVVLLVRIVTSLTLDQDRSARETHIVFFHTLDIKDSPSIVSLNTIVVLRTKPLYNSLVNLLGMIATGSSFKVNLLRYSATLNEGRLERVCIIGIKNRIDILSDRLPGRGELTQEVADNILHAVIVAQLDSDLKTAFCAS